MKISTKITLFIVLLLSVLVVNNLVGLTRLQRIQNELKDVVNQDIVLKDVIASITYRQLKKAIQFQRVLRIAEELGFESMTLPRRNHLLAHSKHVKKRFDGLTDMVDQSINQAKNIVQQRQELSDLPAQKDDLKGILESLMDIESTHQRYDDAVAEVFTLIEKGGFKVSFEEIKEIYREEGRLNSDLQNLVDEVKELAQQSLVRSEENEKTAKQILWFIFFGTMMLISVLGFWIMHSIGEPLKRLLLATQKISLGDFNVTLDTDKHDEIGEVSSAFGMMVKKLSEYRTELEHKNDELGKSLEVAQRQKQDLEKVNTEMDDFVHTVSHDIRAPLMGIRWYAAYLDKHHKDALDKKGHDCVEGISKGINRLNAMIDDLLALTRISRVRNPYNKVSTAGLVRSILERLEVTISKMDVEVHVQKNLPQLFCDQIKIGEVFSNLISNAIKFSSKNPNGKACVEIGYIDLDGFVEFFVKDNGIGIAQENHKEVFDAFKRLHTVNEYEGTGAGLNIVKKVVEEHGGRIWVESEEGKGATFYFTISKNLSNQD